jgi:putative nucleotidyltransferase with HDIG domain
MLPSRESSQQLLEKWVSSPALKHHCTMVAQAMEAYAKVLGQDSELWYHAGLLHDVDWEAFPDEHPKKAVSEWLHEYPEELKQAILAHAPDRTGKQAETLIEKYLFACDELSGFMHAVSILRPGGFEGMSAKSITKKMKDKSFAANVSREDIEHGAVLIKKPLADHIVFLVGVFSKV